VTRRRLLALVAAISAVAAVSAVAQPRTFKDCPHCPEMLAAAPGTFVMGEPPGQRVTITHRVAYARERVSAADWKRCVLAGPCPSLGASGTAGPEPVVGVSWVDVQQYLLWLGLESGVEYRLLSEAEWEYVARSAPGLRGDALEWTSDCWHPDLEGIPADGTSWDADGDCRYHVARGRRAGETSAPITRRYRILFDHRDASIGFRVARTLAGGR
jgi:formylglycine-generating enzyme required for sulfatase activity